MRIAAALAVMLALAPRASGETVAVIAGANVGSGDEDPLRYAVEDAERVRDVLVALGGTRRDRVIFVAAPSPSALARALGEARGRAAELRDEGKRVQFVFYFAGHGDDNALHLPGGNLALEDLRRAADDVPADVHLLLIDACRFAGRARGLQRGPAFSLAAATPAPMGSVELRASAAGEGAQESDELRGGVFTHYLVSGLRGAADLDGDQRVSLSELYAYIYRKTLRASAIAPQHATLSIDLHGAGELILTEPSVASASLDVPRGPERYIVFAVPSDAVMGELSGDEGGRLALPAGRYLVVRRSGARTAVAEVDLSWGGARHVNPRDFRDVAREELVSRGGRLELRHWRAGGALGVEWPVINANGPGLRGEFGVAWSRGRLALGVGGLFTAGTVSTIGFSGTQGSIGVDGSAGLRLWIGRATVVLSLGIEGRWTWQRLVPLDAAQRAGTSLPTSEWRGYGSLGPRAAAALLVPLRNRWVFTLEPSFAALTHRQTDAT
ncbi:MAG: caspase family protein, partial [Polyangia bacterium]